MDSFINLSKENKFVNSNQLLRQRQDVNSCLAHVSDELNQIAANGISFRKDMGKCAIT